MDIELIQTLQSLNNPTLAEAVTNVYNILFESTTANTKDAVAHITNMLHKNTVQTDGDHIAGLAQRSGRDGSSMLDSSEEVELNKISNDIQQQPPMEDDPFTLPSTEEVIPEEQLPQNGGQTSESDNSTEQPIITDNVDDSEIDDLISSIEI